MGGWINGVWRWGFRWRRVFFSWEEDLLRELYDIINPLVINNDDDRWVWVPNATDGFSVKSTYETIDILLLPRIALTPI
jgi:hypothetical protein